MERLDIKRREHSRCDNVRFRKPAKHPARAGQEPGEEDVVRLSADLVERQIAGHMDPIDASAVDGVDDPAQVRVRSIDNRWVSWYVNLGILRVSIK
jgi:hypothetical protein